MAKFLRHRLYFPALLMVMSAVILFFILKSKPIIDIGLVLGIIIGLLIILVIYTKLRRVE